MRGSDATRRGAEPPDNSSAPARCIRGRATGILTAGQLRLLPQLAGRLERVDAGCGPPAAFVARAVEFMVVGAAERDRIFVTDLAAKRPSLGEAEVVRIAGLSPTEQAGLRGHEFEVGLVPVPSRLPDRQQALVDTGRSFGRTNP